MPDFIILEVAKEYGQSPHEVEQWPEYWFHRAAMKLRAERQGERNRTQKPK